MKTFVIGDIHGGHKALLQCFERSQFNKETDKLIALGDITDGWPEIDKCIEELKTVKNLIYILGNHDEWTRRLLTADVFEQIRKQKFSRFSHAQEVGSWVNQGGLSTVECYDNNPLFESHMQFLQDAKPYYLDSDNRLFVHGGFDWDEPIENQHFMELCWNRELTDGMVKGRNYCKDYKEVYVGHTPTLYYKSKVPLNYKNFWMLDTGATYTGSMTIMDIDTKDYWQSDQVMTLYPTHPGRNGVPYNNMIK